MEHALKLMQRGTARIKEVGRTQKERSRDSLRERQNRERLMEEMRFLLEQMSINDRWFEQECDGDLIDACIYEGESLRARYRYLLSQARSMGLCSLPFREIG